MCTTSLETSAGTSAWRPGLFLRTSAIISGLYGVDPAYATTVRPVYTARGGYAGSQFISALSKRFPHYWLGGFVKWDTLHGAVFEDSPLVKRKQNFTAGFAVSWIFAESKTLCKRSASSRFF